MINISTGAWDREALEADRAMREGRPAEASARYREVLRKCPGHVASLRGLAAAAGSMGEYALAAEALGAALRAAPGDVGTMLSLSRALVQSSRLREGYEAARQAGESRGGNAAAEEAMGLAKLAAAEAEAAFEHFERARALAPLDYRASSSPLYAIHYVDGATPERIFAEHQAWGMRYGRAEVAHRNRRDPEKRLRVGYVSADFRNHAVARFIEPVLAHHDREQVETYCYYNFHDSDEWTARLRGLAGRWRDISQLEDEEAAALIRNDEIDLLVDLAGHTADNRLMVFARRPAPVQLTYLGYPATTGLPAMDYRITDAIADPPGEADSLHTERLLRVGPPFLCFGMAGDLPEVGPLPAGSGPITFGSFNTLVKLGRRQMETWGRLLRAVPESRLMLKAAAFADGSVRQRIVEEFGAQGVGAERLLLGGYTAGDRSHLEKYQQVDIALDTFPYNGTTTTCQALAMGVPVVTQAGDRHASRVGKTLMTAVGHPEWVAEDAEEFVAIGRELAGDIGRLRRIRETLRGEVMRSRLVDGAGFTRGLEKAFREVWRAWCGSRA